jgi:glycogen debranching enzyme
MQTEPQDSASDWPGEASRGKPADEAELLKRAQETLLGNLIEGEAWKPYRGVMPSLGTYRGIWNWDSAFHAVALALWDPKLARDQFRILFDKQLPNGMLPDVIFEDGKMVTDFTKPPVMAWAVAVVDRRMEEGRRSKDEGRRARGRGTEGRRDSETETSFLQEMYPKLIRMGEFFERERGGNKDGLFFYAGGHAGNESGWDNAVRWDGGYQTSQTDEKRLWAIDLNCYMVSHYRALADISARLGQKDEQEAWIKKAEGLSRRIDDRLWDEELGFYVDRDRVTHANGPALSPAGFMPLFVHIASPERAERMAKQAADPDKFYPGMPTAAYDTPGYDPIAMWRGPAWLNTSFFALKGLKDYGCVQLANTMRSTLLDWVGRDKRSIYEYYEPKTGAGLAATGFGWSAAFVISFITDWDNDNLTWLFQPISGK